MSFDPAPPEVETDEQAHAKSQCHHREKWQPTSKLSKAEREEMKKLSQLVFKNSSKWQSLIDKGVMIKATKEVSEEVKHADGTTTLEKKQVPIHNRHGKEYSVFKHYTIGELREKMQTLVQQQQAAEKLLEDQRLNEERAKLVEHASGTTF